MDSQDVLDTQSRSPPPSPTTPPPPPSVSVDWRLLSTILTVIGLVVALLADIDLALFGINNDPIILHWHRIRWAIAALCIIAAVPITHGLAGKGAHQSYAFYQPFVGGSAFVILQIVGWTIYAVTVVVFASMFLFASMKVPIVNGILTSAGIGGVVSQICVLVSLRYFDSRRKWYATGRKGILFFNVPKKIDVLSFWVTAFLYQIPLLIAAALGMILLMGGIAGIVGLASAGYLYSFTFKGSPHQTGARSGRLRKDTKLWDICSHYFSFKLIGPSETLESSKKYLFGFHPHGIYPLTTIWATRSSIWKKLVGNVDPEILGASVLFFVPILRDILMSAGCRDVSRESIEHSFSQGRSILLIPGGEREMRENRPESSDITLISKHMGFVRLALMHGANLVPIFSFGEHQVLDNLRYKSIQEYFQKRTMYGFPHLPYGRWYSPIPNPVPITIVVGNPIQLPTISAPSDEQVKYWHDIYYTQLVQLFESHKSQITSFQNANIILE